MCWLGLASVVAAQEDAPERRLDLDEIRTLRDQAAGNAALDAELQAWILERYDDAIGALEAAAVDKAALERFATERAGVGSLVEALRHELGRPDPEPRLTLSEGATAGQAEAALARERSRLAAHRSALRNVEQLSEERTVSRNELSRRLGALDQLIETLADELRSAAQSTAAPELKQATRTALLARREKAAAEIDRLRAELDLLDERGALIPWEIDQAQRRVAHSEQLVALVEEAAHSRRRLETQATLERIRAECREAAELSEALVEIAAETGRFAEILWGPDGVALRSEETTADLVKSRKNVADVERIAQLTRRKFEAYGYRGSVRRWWPQIPDDVPNAGSVAAMIRRLRDRLPEVQHDLIRFEEQRARTRELAQQTITALRAEGTAPDTERAARRLLNTRRELLNQLIQRYGRFSNQLIELETISGYFLEDLQEFQSYLYGRLLWGRSVPRPIVPRFSDLGNALVWLISPDEWTQVFIVVWQRLWEVPARGLGVLALLSLLIAGRGRMWRRMKVLAGHAAGSGRNHYRDTLEALLHTVLLAAPLPLALHFVAEALQHSDLTVFGLAVARALGFMTLAAGLLESSRVLLAPNGLAAAHFGWPVGLTRSLFWPAAVFMVLMQIALQFMAAGQRVTSAPELQLYNNTLGRMAFIVGMTTFGIAVLARFRPRLGSKELAYRSYLYTYPATILTTLVPATLAALGFYVTALLLVYQMLRTFWLALFVLVLGGLLTRWQSLSDRRRERRDDSDSGLGNLAAAALQTRKLFRFVLVLVAAAGFYTIWAEAIPTLQVIKRVQIWPSVSLLEAKASGVEIGRTAGEPSIEEGSDTDTSPSPSIPGIPGGGTTSTPAERAGSTSLTLWNLLQALVAIIITFGLAWNIPGLLEMILQRRTSIDAGVRIAFGTLVRYSIMILGVSISFGQLGISWSKIQWLAAALTFGLGFGLQEIVANFVSGLILLMERPVRVGDAVTIGNLQGLVTRIQIRATTITLWDCSEMIVPNKEFITSKLVNWTLSDSKRRVSVPLRIAYGSDLEKVKQTLLDVAVAHPSVLDDPAPMALLIDFGSDAIQFELRFFVDFGRGLLTKDEIQMSVDRAFREAGIDFALPQLDIRIPRRQAPGSRGGPPPESEG